MLGNCSLSSPDLCVEHRDVPNCVTTVGGDEFLVECWIDMVGRSGSEVGGASHRRPGGRLRDGEEEAGELKTSDRSKLQDWSACGIRARARASPPAL